MSKHYWLLAILCFCLVIGTLNGSMVPSVKASAAQTNTAKGEQNKSIELFPFEESTDSKSNDSGKDRFGKLCSCLEAQGGRSGYIDKTGKEVIKLGSSYHFPRSFSEGLAAVTIVERDKDGEIRQKIAYIDKTGQLVIKPEFEDSDNEESEGAKTFSEGLAAVALKKGDFYKHGYINKTGKVVIPLQYDEVHSFSEGLAVVATLNEGDWQFAFINKKGEKVFEHPQLSSAEGFSEGLAAVRIGNKWGYISKSGIAIEPQFSGAESFSEGLAAVTLREDNEFKVGYIDRTGKFVIKLQFSSASSFAEGLAAVQVGGFKGKWGYIDKTGKFVIQPQFEAFPLQTVQFSEGLASVAMWTAKETTFGLSGFIDKTGKFIIKPQFNTAEPFSGGLAKVEIYPYTERGDVSTNDPKQGYIDKAGKFVWSGKY